MGRKFKDRIVNNYAALLALVKILGPVLKLPFSFEYFYKYSIGEVIRLTSLISDSNALAGFWKSAEFLLDTGKAAEGWDFIIETVMNVEIKVDGEKKLIPFDVATKLLFLRIDNLHSQYLILHRQQNGGVGINKPSLLLYISQEKYYLGNNPSKRFTHVDAQGNKKTSVTSSYVLIYDEIGVNLERLEFDASDTAQQHASGFKTPVQTGIDFNKIPIDRSAPEPMPDDDLPFSYAS
ncbi:hypothetical protein QQ054_32010 [Oscillatoria amoena NRMC-F 0135]|nr:hypothetical protein [Oscillatoria amoena NRMC-F 0135]